MDRKKFQALARTRIADAEALIAASRYSAGYYLAGYAIECALKACIAKRTKRYEFPDKEFVKAYTHNLDALLNLALLKPILDSEPATSVVRANWAIVKDWKETDRYEEIPEKKSRDLYSAIADKADGMLAWIRKHW